MRGMLVVIAVAAMLAASAAPAHSASCSNLGFLKAAQRPLVLEGYAYDQANHQRYRKAQRWAQDAYLAMIRTPDPCRKTLSWFRGYKLEAYGALAAAYDAFADGDREAGRFLLSKVSLLQDLASEALASS